jgi:hypothetical protein
MARVGNETQAVWLKNILRQSDGPQSQTKLDELADSLSRRAVDPASARRDTEAYNRAVDAVLTLLQAGAIRGASGTPYAGAFDRLVTVHRQGRSHYVRRTALASMLATSHSRGVDYLQRVVESSDSTARDALEFLTLDADGGSPVAVTPTAAERQQSVSAMKALASGNRPSDPEVRERLAHWLRRYRTEHPSGGPP